MFDNLTGKQGMLFGLITGVALSAVAGFAIMAPTILKQNYTETNLANNYPPTQPQDQQTPPTAITPASANIPKSSKPKVELFVMSNCPYGLQMEKALLPAYDLLKKKADIDIKFVSYAMHGKEEVDENTRQHCAQQQDKDKYFSYLNCYTTTQDSSSCMKQSGLNESKINNCIDKTDKQFAITDTYNDQTTWLNGRYPIYPVHADLNNKYGVQGSPTLVINGVQVEANRTPDGLKAIICSAFSNPPDECAQILASASTQPGFGAEQARDTITGGCGG